MSHNGYGRGLHGVGVRTCLLRMLGGGDDFDEQQFCLDENKSFGLDNVREVEDFFDSKLNFVNKSTINGR